MLILDILIRMCKISLFSSLCLNSFLSAPLQSWRVFCWGPSRWPSHLMEWSDCCLRHSVCIWREGYRQTFSLFMRTLSNSYVLMTYSRFKCLNKAPSIHWFSSAYPVQGCRVDGAYLSCHRARGGIHPGQTLTFTPLSKAGVPGESPHRCEENMQTPLVFTDFLKKSLFSLFSSLM